MPEHFLLGEAERLQLMDQFFWIKGLFPLQQFGKVGELFESGEERLIVPEG